MVQLWIRLFYQFKSILNYVKMETPKSLSWCLANGYGITAINGTDNLYCYVDVESEFPPMDYPPRHQFLMSTSYMKSRFSSVFNEISLPF